MFTVYFALLSYVCFVSFLSRVSILTRDIDIANMSVRPSVCPSVHCVPVSEDVSKFVHSSLETRECNPEETVLQPEL